MDEAITLYSGVGQSNDRAQPSAYCFMVARSPLWVVDSDLSTSVFLQLVDIISHTDLHPASSVRKDILNQFNHPEPLMSDQLPAVLEILIHNWETSLTLGQRRGRTPAGSRWRGCSPHSAR